MPLPRWVEPQLSKLVEKAPTNPHWVHEIKFDGYRLAARIECGSKVQLLTRPPVRPVRKAGLLSGWSQGGPVAA
jgi:hypothetical protein